MLPYRALILAVALTSSPAWAFQRAAETKISQPPAAVPESKGPDADANLIPRQPLPKRAYVSKPLGESRLCIKFRDDVKARIQPNNKVLLTAGAADSTALDLVTEQYGIRFVSKGNVSLEKLAALEARAAAYSGKAQPDLAGMMYVEGPEGMLEAAANTLKNLDIVEYVYFRTPWKPYGGPVVGACCTDGVCEETTEDLCLAGQFFAGQTCAPSPCLGACCVDGTCIGELNATDCATAEGEFFLGETCADEPCNAACCLWDPFNAQWVDICVRMQDCLDAGGVFRGGSCDDADCDLECGDAELGSCFEEHSYPFCGDDDCCELIALHRPSCATAIPFAEWDFVCVSLANLFCTTPPGEPDPCITPFAGNCFIAHITPGCINADCCHTVCDVEPFCCTGNWDSLCVSLAWALCDFTSDDATPDLTSAQGYLRPSSYDNQFQGPPAGPIPPLPPPPPVFLLGYLGEGFNLFAEGPDIGPPVRWADDPSMPVPQRFRGLYGLGRELNEVYGIGLGNLARGSTIKVAVIEWAYHQDHEDLNVISEPGQTLIVIPDVTHPDHATACLGIINAQDNGFGMVGIAPDAEAYFFPLTSVEEGPRAFAAFINCIDALDPGDVISCSFGSGNSNLVNEEDSWTWIRLASDLGITVCVAAGNDCFDLSQRDDLGDSGAIVVGASSPGFPFCRLDFSNYAIGTNIANSQDVHVSAWGDRVASTGYGDLFYGGSPGRSYTQFFNGTSAAAPQIAGIAACLQGLAKQFYGIALPTGAPGNNFIRASMMMSGFPQCGGAPQGFNSELDCGFDVITPETVRETGVFARPRLAGHSVLSQWGIGFDESPLLTQVYLLRGLQPFGTIFSLKGRDNTYFVVRSQYTDRSHTPTISTPNPEANFVASKAFYLASGYHADIMTQMKSPVKQAGTMSVALEVQLDAPFSLLMVEAFDWVTNKWTFVGFQYPLLPTPQGAEPLIGFQAQPATQYINPSSLNAYIRTYVLTFGGGQTDPSGLGGLGGDDLGPVIRFDWISAAFTSGFGQPISGGGGAGSPN